MKNTLNDPFKLKGFTDDPFKLKGFTDDPVKIHGLTDLKLMTEILIKICTKLSR